MATSKQSTGELSSAPTYSLGASPANPSAWQESGEGKKTNAGCGQSLPEPFAYYDPDTCSWKMSQGCFDSDLQTSRMIWPDAGMTRNGRAYRRRRLAPRISVRGSGLWPTPTKTDRLRTKFSLESHMKCAANHKRRGQYKTRDLFLEIADEFSLFPTPEMVEWLMGYPETWTDLEDSAMP